jgi:hypothetical protein
MRGERTVTGAGDLHMLPSSSGTMSEPIREILLRAWDPLFVGDNKNLADEYDEFIPDIETMIQAGATVDELSQALFEFQKLDLGMNMLGTKNCAAAALELARLAR